MVPFEFLAKDILPVLARVQGKIGVLKELKAQGTGQIGNRGDTLGELADGVLEGSISRWHRTRRQCGMREEKRNQEKKVAKQGKVKF